jgi:hypothetical protein
VNVHAAGLVQLVVVGGHALRGDALQNALLHLEDVHLEAGFHRHRCHLEADVAAADDDHALARRHLGANAVHVVDAAQVVNARQVAAGYGQAPRPAAGGDQQLFVADHLACIGGHGVGRGVDLLGPARRSSL